MELKRSSADWGALKSEWMSRKTPKIDDRIWFCSLLASSFSTWTLNSSSWIWQCRTCAVAGATVEVLWEWDWRWWDKGGTKEDDEAADDGPNEDVDGINDDDDDEDKDDDDGVAAADDDAGTAASWDWESSWGKNVKAILQHFLYIFSGEF